MTGFLFVVTIPSKGYEVELNKEKSSIIIIEKEKCGKSFKFADELQENKVYGSLKKTHKTNSQNEMTKGFAGSNSDSSYINVDICKSKSENTLSGITSNETKFYSWSSWTDLWHSLKPSRNKLNITRPGTGMNMLSSFHWDTPLENILSEVIHRLDIKNATWSSAKNDKFWQVIFSLESGCRCEELLQVLRTFGIGSRLQSSISVIPCSLYYNSVLDGTTREDDLKETQSEATSWSRFFSTVRARTNLAQVLQDVRAEATLTFDWLFLLIVAAFVAAIGLVENSTVILVASMLISPLMGPITAATLGTAVRDRSLQLMGVMHELLGLFLSLVIGFIFGLCICAVDEHYGVGDWPTYEMISRCEIRSLWVGLLVAIPSGAGVALAVLGEYTASFVGVAISASLLPPAVNAGLLWAMSLVHYIFKDDDTRWTNVVKTTVYSHNQSNELAVLGAVSLCLTLVNIICIFLVGVAVYKIKEVSPLDRRDIPWWRASRNYFQTPKTKHINREMPVLWRPISNWCNEVKESMDHENKKTIPNNIQNDPTTYSRMRGLSPLFSSHNIEEILTETNPITQANQNYEATEADSETLGKFSINMDYGIITNADVKDEKDTKFFQFNNMSFENDDNIYQDNSKDQPTIEPTLNFTMNLKKCDFILNKQSYTV